MKATCIPYGERPKIAMGCNQFPDYCADQDNCLASYKAENINQNLTFYSAGCSYATASVGVMKKDFWGNIICEHIIKKTGASLFRFDVGWAAQSNDYVSRNTMIVTNNIKIDVACILFTWPNRREFVWHTGDYIPFGPWNVNPVKQGQDIYPCKKNDGTMYGNPYEQFAGNQNEHDDLLNFEKNFRFIELMFKDNGTKWVYGFAEEFDLPKKYYKDDRYAGFFEKLDLADDGDHPGTKSHHLMAKRFISKLEDLYEIL